MAITTAATNSGKVELGLGYHNGTTSTGDAYKLLLIESSQAGTYGASTTNVGTPGTGTPSTSNTGTDAHVSTGDYNSINGVTLTNVTPTLSGSTAVWDFDDVVMTGTTISADGFLIYNSATKGGVAGRVLSVHSFGSTKTTTGGTFTIQMPVADASNAIYRVA